MTRRAYSPRPSTVALVADILARPGIARVHTIAPSIYGGVRHPARLRIYLADRYGSGDPVYSDFTLADARAWLDAERAQEAER